MKAIFNTKIVANGQDYSLRNGEEVEIVSKQKGKDVYSDRYTVKFGDGTVMGGIMDCELTMLACEEFEESEEQYGR